MSGLRFETYAFAGRPEWMMRSGPSDGPQVVVLLPFFHEANRLRTLAAALMRRLGDQNIGCVLPDLPGCGESLAPLPPSLDHWLAAAGAVVAATGARAALAIRTGALVDAVVPPDRRWRLSPATGASLMRDLIRSRMVEAREAGQANNADTLATAAREQATRLAGYVLPAGLFGTLEAAHPDPVASRTVRLAGDDRPADTRIAGSMLWRQSEPTADDAFANALATDFSAWAISCGGF